ncbi:MAG TPA: hypothetical protein PK789_06410 [Thermomonas sp.]|jgi:hypothetical protein|uniref:hypothetical protein n=1 Tax=Thermomonas sp. TaxID=1971895 RepID=UPI002BEC6B83|nr:hypothetical protein [Thermomonas sp.]HOV96383.1 hypothetical protein [Thermomonas sp.]
MRQSTLPGIVLALTLTACQPSAPTQPVAAVPQATPPAAAAARGNPTGIHITRMDLGNTLGSDQRVVQPLLVFAPTDTIHAVLIVEGHDTAPHHLVARWTHLTSKQTVLEEGKTLVFHGPAITGFQISKPDGWPLGQYKVELLLDDVLVQTRLFEVLATPVP